MENCGNDYYNREDLRSLLFECMNEILEISASHGFEGNLWHTYLTFLLVNDENAYSTSCEIIGEIDGSINRIALHDFQIFKELFDYDFQEMEREFSAECMQILFEYKNTSNAGKVFNRRIRDRICNLAEGLADSSDAIDFKRKMTQFYKEFGDLFVHRNGKENSQIYRKENHQRHSKQFLKYRNRRSSGNRLSEHPAT